MPTNLPTVIVVGGGISGLAAASHLVKTGEVNVTLLEGASRIGGRVHSFKLGEHFVEEGAEWVHGENKIFELANPFGLLNTNPNDLKFGQNVKYVTQTGRILDSSVEEKVNQFLKELSSGEDVCDSNEVFGNYAMELFNEHNRRSLMHEDEGVRAGILDWIHRLETNIEGTDNWFEQSCKGHFAYKSCEGNLQTTWKRPACYNSIFEIILNEKPGDISDLENPVLPDWIHLQKKVTRIQYNGEQNVDAEARAPGEKFVKVFCADGSQYLADHVICTVSLGVLKTDACTLFRPPLPAQKSAVIESLGFGTVNKIFIEFESEWWPKDCNGFNLIWENDRLTQGQTQIDVSEEDLLKETNGIPTWCRNLLGLYPKPNHPNLLMMWTMGPAARLVETLDHKTLIHAIQMTLKTFLGNTHEISQIQRVTTSKWHSNPLTRGSYSFNSINCDERQLKPEELWSPVNSGGKPVLCFAGEATHPYYFSAVHGAYESGIREANRLIEFHRGQANP